MATALNMARASGHHQHAVARLSSSAFAGRHLVPLRRLRHAPSRQQSRAGASVQAAQKQAFKTFEEMIEQSQEPVLVDFYATWCGPCQMQSQVLDQVAPQMKGRVKIVKVDTEKYHKVASQYNIGALPTLVLFKGGRPVDRMEGMVMADQLRARLEYFLTNSN